MIIKDYNWYNFNNKDTKPRNNSRIYIIWKPYNNIFIRIKPKSYHNYNQLIYMAKILYFKKQLSGFIQPYFCPLNEYIIPGSNLEYHESKINLLTKTNYKDIINHTLIDIYSPHLIDYNRDIKYWGYVDSSDYKFPEFPKNIILEYNIKDII